MAQESGVSVNVELWEVYFINDSEGWIVGGDQDGGVILHTKNGGVLTGVDERNNKYVKNYGLEQNYPNPLNEKTRIEFKIPKKGHVNLSIYNQSGQIVKKLVNTELNEGEHTRIWNAQDISAGTYFLHLESNGIISVQKLIIIK